MDVDDGVLAAETLGDAVCEGVWLVLDVPVVEELEVAVSDAEGVPVKEGEFVELGNAPDDNDADPLIEMERLEVDDCVDVLVDVLVDEAVGVGVDVTTSDDVGAAVIAGTTNTLVNWLAVGAVAICE